MYNIIQENTAKASYEGLKTFLISCSLAMGIVFVTSFIKVIKNIRDNNQEL
jgi:uncharacterized membrane protein YjjB (DUF3815 family)